MKADFHRDDEWQKGKRDRYLAPFYCKYSMAGRFVFVDKSKCSTLIQKRLAVDTLLQCRDGGSVCIEEKIVRWKGQALEKFFLETESNTNAGHEKTGWMRYGEADYLLYCFELPNDDLDCYLIPFPALKTWFWSHEKEFHRHTMPHTINKTAGRLVPVTDVAEAVKSVVRFIAGGSGRLEKMRAEQPRWRMAADGRVPRLDAGGAVGDRDHAG